MIVGEIVKKYLQKYKNTNWHSLARQIYRENNLVFHDAEHARSVIRYYRGAKGYKNRLSIRKLSKNDKQYNKYNLPDSDETELEPVFIEHKKTLILADVHIPYHRIESLEICIDFAKEYKPDAILFLGDLIDMYMISKFNKDPTQRNIKGEIKQTIEFLKRFKELIPAEQYLKYGNHEERWDIFLMNKAPEMYDVEEMHLDYQLRNTGVNIIKDKRRVRIGKLDILHGHELFGGVWSPVNTARGLYLKAKKTSACGHTHMTSEHTSVRLNEEIVTCWSIGCMCELHQNYRPYGDINNGFATVDLHDNGMFNFKNYRIHNGEIL